MLLDNCKVMIAPMMDCTDRHYRFLVRLISRQTRLYTEMITANAIIHGDRDYLLGYAPQEHPVALQVGGSEPKVLARCAEIAQEWGYDEINLNVGCPSDRVQAGQIGAILMKAPEIVADCVAAMKSRCHIPVTVKCRLGVDECDSYQQLVHFVQCCKQAGCGTLIVHARKAWLQGLSPRENREVPPLNYERVYQLKQDFPELQIIINGGVKNLDEVAGHLLKVDGVMIGRAAYTSPYLLSGVDSCFYQGAHPIRTQHEVIEQYLPYIDAELSKGVKLRSMTRHLVGFFTGQPGAKSWRRYLSEQAGENSVTVVERALRLVQA